MSRRRRSFKHEEYDEDDDSDRPERRSRHFACRTCSSGSWSGGSCSRNLLRGTRRRNDGDYGGRNSNDTTCSRWYSKRPKRRRGSYTVRFNDNEEEKVETKGKEGTCQQEGKIFGGKNNYMSSPNWMARRTSSDSSSVGSMGFEPENALEEEELGCLRSLGAGNIEIEPVVKVKEVAIQHVVEEVKKVAVAAVQTQTRPFVVQRKRSSKMLPVTRISSSSRLVSSPRPQRSTRFVVANILNNNRNDSNNNDVRQSRRTSAFSRSSSSLVGRKKSKVEGIKTSGTRTKLKSCFPSKSLHEMKVQRQEVMVYQVHNDGHSDDDEDDEEEDDDEHSDEDEESEETGGKKISRGSTDKRPSLQGSSGPRRSGGSTSSRVSKGGGNGHDKQKPSKTKTGSGNSHGKGKMGGAHHKERHHQKERSIQDEDILSYSGGTTLQDSFFEQEILDRKHNQQKTDHQQLSPEPNFCSPLPPACFPPNNASGLFQSIPPPPPGFCQEIRVNVNQNPPQVVTQVVPCPGSLPQPPQPPCPPPPICPPPATVSPLDPCVPLQITCTPAATYSQPQQSSSNCNNNPCCCQSRSGMFSRLTQGQRIRCQRCRVLSYCKTILGAGLSGDGRSIRVECCAGSTSRKDLNNNGVGSGYLMPPYQVGLDNMDGRKWKSEYCKEFKDWSKERPLQDYCLGNEGGRDAAVSIQGSSLKEYAHAAASNGNHNEMSPVRHGTDKRTSRNAEAPSHGGGNMYTPVAVSRQVGGPGNGGWPAGYGGQYHGSNMPSWNNGGGLGCYPNVNRGGAPVGQMGVYPPPVGNVPTSQMTRHPPPGGSLPTNRNSPNEYVFLIGPGGTLVSGGGGSGGPRNNGLENGNGFPSVTNDSPFPYHGQYGNNRFGYPYFPGEAGGRRPYPDDGYGNYSYAQNHGGAPNAKSSTPWFANKSAGPAEYDKGLDWDKDPYPFFTKGPRQHLFPMKHGRETFGSEDDNGPHRESEGRVHYPVVNKRSFPSRYGDEIGGVPHDHQYHPHPPYSTAGDGRHPDPTYHSSRGYPTHAGYHYSPPPGSQTGHHQRHRIRNTEEADRGSGPGPWGHWGKDWVKRNRKGNKDGDGNPGKSNKVTPHLNDTDTSWEDLSDDDSHLSSHRGAKTKHTTETGTNPHGDSDFVTETDDDEDEMRKRGKKPRPLRKPVEKGKTKAPLKPPKEKEIPDTSPSPPPSPITVPSKTKPRVQNKASKEKAPPLPKAKEALEIPSTANSTPSLEVVEEKPSKAKIPPSTKKVPPALSKQKISPASKKVAQETPSNPKIPPSSGEKAQEKPSKTKIPPAEQPNQKSKPVSVPSKGKTAAPKDREPTTPTAGAAQKPPKPPVQPKANAPKGKSPPPPKNNNAKPGGGNTNDSGDVGEGSAASSYSGPMILVKKTTFIRKKKQDTEGDEGNTTEFSEPPTPPKSPVGNTKAAGPSTKK